MAYTRTHETDDVFVWTFTGRIDAEEFHRWYVETREVTFASPLHTLYHIMDVLKAETDFGAILSQMREVGQAPFVAIDNRSINFLFVGTSDMAKLAVNLARQPQFGGFDMPMFRTMADALEFIRVNRVKSINVPEPD